MTQKLEAQAALLLSLTSCCGLMLTNTRSAFSLSCRLSMIANNSLDALFYKKIEQYYLYSDTTQGK